MERTDKCWVVPARFRWSDLGTWASLYAECPQDDQENVLQGAVNPKRIAARSDAERTSARNSARKILA